MGWLSQAQGFLGWLLVEGELLLALSFGNQPATIPCVEMERSNEEATTCKSSPSSFRDIAYCPKVSIRQRAQQGGSFKNRSHGRDVHKFVHNNT